jgi:hypothetical protein
MNADPHDIAAEQATLGAMLLSPAVTEQVRKILVPADFYRPAHGALYSAISRLSMDTAVDAIILNSHLQDHPVAGVDPPYLHTLLRQAQIVANGPLYARTVRGHSVTRRLQLAAARASQWSQSPELTEDPTALTERIMREFEEARRQGTGEDITPVTADVFLNVDPEEDEYDWAIPHLLERKDRLILTGVEGAGKSTLFRQMAVMAAAGIHPFSLARHEPRRCLLLDFENSKRHTRRKLWPLIETAMKVTGKFNPENLWIECRTGGVDLSIDKGVSWMIQQVTAIKPDIVFLGPLYKLAPRALNDDSDAAPVLAALDMIRERNACVVLEAHSGHAVGTGGKRDVRVRGSAAFMGWPEFAYGLRWAEGSTKTRRLVDFVPWRGDRDERQWPEQLVSGGLWPWSETVPEAAPSNPWS